MKIKKLKIKLNKDNEYSDYRYFIPKSNNIKMTDGRDVDEAVQSLKNKIANLKEQANYLIDKAPLVKYAEGSSIIATGCAEIPLKKTVIEGDSYQRIREGYNKFNYKNITHSDNVINNGDGTFSSKVDKHVAIINCAANSVPYDDFSLAAGTYSVYFKITTTVSVTLTKLYLCTLNSSDTTENLSVTLDIPLSAGVETIINTSYILQDDKTAVGLVGYFNGVNTGFTISDIMIYEGTDIKPYEAYGVSPSIDFPALIYNVGDNINLLNLTFAKDTGADVGITINKNDDGTYIINGTSTSIIANIWLLGGYTTTQTLFTIPKGEYTIQDIALFSYDGTNRMTITAELGKSNSFILNEDFNVTAVRFPQIKSQKTYNNEIAYPKLEKGTQATPYSPYGQGSIAIKQVNGNLADFNVSQNTKVIVNNDGTVTVNGNGGFSLNFKQITFNANKIYYMNWIVESGKATLPNNNIIMIPGGDRWAKQGEYTGFSFNEDTIKSSLWVNVNATFENAKIRIWISEERIKYTPHQSQTKTLYIQQPFRAIGNIKDRFVKQNEVWYEEHKIAEGILNGTETWTWHPENFAFHTLKGLANMPITETLVMSNYLLGVEHGENGNVWKNNNGIIFSWNSANILCIKDTNNFSDVDSLKAKLAELYANGIPLYVDYVLAEPKLIPCTSEQVIVLEQLKTYYGTTYIDTDIINQTQANIKLIYKQDINAILEGEEI